jgi:hypothetical protein
MIPRGAADVAEPVAVLVALQLADGWLRHSQLTTTMNVYIHQVDDGLGSADVGDDILPAPGATPGATEHPETAANARSAHPVETVS